MCLTEDEIKTIDTDLAVHDMLSSLQNVQVFIKEEHLKNDINNFFYDIKSKLVNAGYITK